jgi:type I restriction enzyme S subunit
MTWERTRLKFVTRFGYGDALPQDEPHEGPFRVYGSNGPYAQFVRANTKSPAIVVGRKGSYGKVNWSVEPCFASDTTFFIDSTLTEQHLRWLFWALQTLGLDEGSDEAAVPGLNREDAYGKRLLLPDPPAQQSIASYLDRETELVDSLLLKRGQVLQLLAEKRRAVIGRAVLRGIDEAALMRDSGIEWLGEIPRHWETERAKWLFEERDERSTTGEEVLLSLRMEQGLVPHNDVSDRPVPSEDLVGYKKAYKQDIVVNRMRAASGLVAVSPLDGLVSPDYAVFRVRDDVNPYYFGQLFKTDLLQTVFRSESTGLGTGSSGFLRLYSENFLSLWLPSPPRDEQGTIVDHITAVTRQLDDLHAATLRSIELLGERRAAVISAAVTGEIAVKPGES